ncbi:MAG: hypothetical protein BGO12_09320 [Verrucomicrobia bacterium 61-8]|nr:DUF58 domain-containing protein [Verrucomicrobiota bacterium]OJV25301.1 MAG: hypothetical protein BGO12_09320 [Verrucomicrobia bacterium 61-8]
MAENLLDPQAVSRGEALGLMARRIVEGYRVGEHRSPFHGFAIEFAQHREYSAGDDIRHLDWKVLGRSDRYYIKQYEQDTNYVAHIAVDGSASMNYGSGKVSKLHFAKALAACLAYVILLQRDAVALMLFDTERRDYLPRTDSLGRINHIMNRLAAFEATGHTSFGRSLEQLAQEAKRRGIVILLSDLFGDEEQLASGLQRLAFSGNEVIVFHTLDHAEITFPFTGVYKFRDLEGDAELQTSPADIRKSYLKNFEDYRQRIRRICEKFNAHYVLADTEKPLAEVLSGYLAFRRNTGRR